MARHRIAWAQRRLRKLAAYRGPATGARAPGPPPGERVETGDGPVSPARLPERPAPEPRGDADPVPAETPGEDPGWAERVDDSLAGRLGDLRHPDATAPPSGRPPAHRAGGAWRSLSQTTRARIAAFTIVAAVAALVLLLALPGGEDESCTGAACIPPDDAIGLVPKNALAYAHVELEPGPEQSAALGEITARLPLLSRLAIGSAAATGDAPLDLPGDLGSWSGSQVALVALRGGGRVGVVTMVEVADAAGAERFAAELVGPKAEVSRVGETELLVEEDEDLAAAVFEGFLLAGREDDVAAVVEQPAGTARLAALAAPAIDQLPEVRVAYGYLSPLGARTLLTAAAGRDLPIDPSDTLIEPKATSGVAASLSADGDALRLAIRSKLDPVGAEASEGLLDEVPSVAPQLDAEVGPDALAYLGLGDPAAAVESASGGLAAGASSLDAVDRLQRRLRRERIDAADALPLLGSEIALSLEPTGAVGVEETPGTLIGSGVPYASLIASGVDPEAASESLRRLQRPLIDVLDPPRAKRASFRASEVDGIEVQGLRVSDDVELTYATFDERLVVATDPLGVERALAGGDGLDSSERYRAATSGLPAEASLFAYLDLRELLALGEQLGLAVDPVYATYAPDLRNLDAAALAIVATEAAIETDLRVTVAEPAPVGVETPPVVGE